MNTDFINYYNQIEKIDFNNYIINHDYNIKNLKLLNYVSDLSIEHNFTFRLTGAWAFVLETNKIYRTINDIDIIIKKNDLRLFIQLIDDNFNYYFDDDPKEFFLKSLKRQSRIFRFKNKLDTDQTLDVILTDKTTDEDYSNKIIGAYSVKYRLPYKFLKKDDEYFYYGRDIDSDDEKFYSKYLN